MPGPSGIVKNWITLESVHRALFMESLSCSRSKLSNKCLVHITPLHPLPFQPPEAPNKSGSHTISIFTNAQESQADPLTLNSIQFPRTTKPYRFTHLHPTCARRPNNTAVLMAWAALARATRLWGSGTKLFHLMSTGGSISGQYQLEVFDCLP